jgi:hypothetical protein
MDRAALQTYLLRLFERHEIELDEDEDGWLLTDGDYPAINASWHEGAAGAPGRLDVDVVLDEDRRIEESFAGIGDGEAGCREALQAFEQGALPLLLAACWYVTDERKMRIAAWQIGVRTWDVFVGPFKLRGAPADVPEAGVMEAIEAAMKREALTPELHWVRLVHSHDAEGSARSEALLDNEPWAAGTQALTTIAWPPADAAYSARAFLMLDVRDY